MAPAFKLSAGSTSCLKKLPQTERGRKKLPPYLFYRGGRIPYCYYCHLSVIPCCCPASKLFPLQNSCSAALGMEIISTQSKRQEELFNFPFSCTFLPADPCVGKILAQNWKEVRVIMECNTYGVLLMTRRLNTTDNQWNIW